MDLFPLRNTTQKSKHPLPEHFKIDIETKSAFSGVTGDSGTLTAHPSCLSALERLEGTSQFQKPGSFLTFKSGKQKEKSQACHKTQALLKCKLEFLQATLPPSYCA